VARVKTARTTGKSANHDKSTNGYGCLNRNVFSSWRNCDSVLDATMSGGKLFHSRALETAKPRSPTVVHCDWRTSSWCVSEDRRRRFDGMSENVAGLQPGMMEPCRSASERRSSPARTAHARALSTSGNWRVCR